MPHPATHHPQRPLVKAGRAVTLAAGRVLTALLLPLLGFASLGWLESHVREHGLAVGRGDLHPVDGRADEPDVLDLTLAGVEGNLGRRLATCVRGDGRSPPRQRARFRESG